MTSVLAQLRAISAERGRRIGQLAVCLVAVAVGAWSAPTGAGQPGAPSSPHAPPFPALDVALLRQVASGAPDENIVLSPFSLGMAAIPLLVGTTGEVQKEWAVLLRGVGAGTPPDIAADAVRLAEAIARDTAITFRSANALWAPPTVPFRATLADSLRRTFGATIRTVDVTTQAGINAVNAWTDSATRGRDHAQAILAIGRTGDAQCPHDACTAHRADFS